MVSGEGRGGETVESAKGSHVSGEGGETVESVERQWRGGEDSRGMACQVESAKGSGRW